MNDVNPPSTRMIGEDQRSEIKQTLIKGYNEKSVGIVPMEWNNLSVFSIYKSRPILI